MGVEIKIQRIKIKELKIIIKELDEIKKMHLVYCTIINTRSQMILDTF